MAPILCKSIQHMCYKLVLFINSYCLTTNILQEDESGSGSLHSANFHPD